MIAIGMKLEDRLLGHLNPAARWLLDTKAGRRFHASKPTHLRRGRKSPLVLPLGLYPGILRTAHK
jgi:hypothetical protein